MQMFNGQPPLIDTSTGALHPMWVQWYSQRTACSVQDAIAAGTMHMLELQQRMIGFLRENTINPRGVAAGYSMPFGMPGFNTNGFQGAYAYGGGPQTEYPSNAYTNHLRNSGRYPATPEEPSLFYKEADMEDHPWVMYMLNRNPGNPQSLIDVCKGLSVRLMQQPRTTPLEPSIFGNSGPSMVTPSGHLSLLWVLWQSDRDHTRSLEVIHDEGVKVLEAERNKHKE